RVRRSRLTYRCRWEDDQLNCWVRWLFDRLSWLGDGHRRWIGMEHQRNDVRRLPGKWRLEHHQWRTRLKCEYRNWFGFFLEGSGEHRWSRLRLVYRHAGRVRPVAK